MVSVAELRRQREAVACVNHETYKLLYTQVQTHIRTRATNKCTDVVWVVPPFVPGRPVYNARHAARYVSEKLRRGGFDVNVTVSGDVCVLYITWSLARDTPSEPEEPRETPATSLHEASRSLEKLKARLRLD